MLEKGGGMVRREWRARPARGGEGEGAGQGDEAGKGARAAEGEGVEAERVPSAVASASMATAVTSSSEDEHEQRPWSPPDSPEQGWLSLVRPPEQVPAEPPAPIPEASMDDLSVALEGVSLGMVPRSVLKARAKAKAKEMVMDVERVA